MFVFSVNGVTDPKDSAQSPNTLSHKFFYCFSPAEKVKVSLERKMSYSPNKLISFSTNSAQLELKNSITLQTY